MNDRPNKPDAQKEDEMSGGNFELRLYRLEQAFDSERLPYRMQAVEIGLAQIQGEVVAVKEIARGIGTKLDSGMRELAMEQTRNQSFMRGVLWIGGIAISILSPLVIMVAQQLLKQAS